MSGIALVPIDNRPVCYQLAQMIAAQDKEHTLFLPDIKLSGSLTKCADSERILQWLETLNNIDIFIISLDTIAYGGLIPSRKCSDNIEIIKERIKSLEHILKKQKAKVYAFSSIMRISNNNINEEEKEYWGEWGKKIFEYSYFLHKNGQSNTEIPDNILTDYLNTRERNFEINKYYIELKKQNLIDTLVFSKDDCAEFGLNIMEAEKLNKISKDIDNIFIKTGADEIPLTLLSRALNKSKKIKIYPVYTNPESVNLLSKYEDITVKEAVESQIKLSGGILSDENNCDMILIVNNFSKEQGELVMGVNVPLFEDTLKIPDKPFLIADILNANGGDNNFVEQLLSQDLKNFYGYAGWNSTGNTLGSVLSQGLTYFKAKNPDTEAFNKLQAIRFLDDWGYQANIREKIRSNKKNLISKTLKLNMQKYEKIIASIFKIKEEIHYTFPWKRFFEIKIDISDSQK